MAVGVPVGVLVDVDVGVLVGVEVGVLVGVLVGVGVGVGVVTEWVASDDPLVKFTPPVASGVKPTESVLSAPGTVGVNEQL